MNYNYYNNQMPNEMNHQMNGPYQTMPNMYNHTYEKDDRFLGGGFIFPFLLGGVTGAALAPNFYRRPFYPPYPMYRPFPPYYRPF